jgi:hypothetical protein
VENLLSFRWICFLIEFDFFLLFGGKLIGVLTRNSLEFLPEILPELLLFLVKKNATKTHFKVTQKIPFNNPYKNSI